MLFKFLHQHICIWELLDNLIHRSYDFLIVQISEYLIMPHSKLLLLCELVICSYHWVNLLHGLLWWHHLRWLVLHIVGNGLDYWHIDFYVGLLLLINLGYLNLLWQARHNI